MSKEKRSARGGFGMGGGHARGAMGQPVEKAKDFRGTLRRLLVYLRPYRLRLGLVLIMTIASAVFTIWSPKIMGRAIDVLVDGLIAKFTGVPGAGVDFSALASVMFLLAGFYALSSLFSYVQGLLMAVVAQRTVFSLRTDVNDKLARLPLAYYDSRPHGETLSLVTNDIDNIANTLQQSIGQLLTSVVTLIGVIYMMLTISPLLTLITVVTLPLSVIITAMVAKRSQRFFKAQQRVLAELNGQVEETYTGQQIIKAYGHQRKAISEFAEVNDRLYDAGWKAQFASGIIFPLMNMVSNIGYVLVSVVGGVMVTRQAITIGNIQAFIQYARQFGMPIQQVANIANVIQSTVASAERVFTLLDETEELPDASDAVALSSVAGDVSFASVDFSYSPDVPLIEDMNIDVRSGQTVAIVGPTGAGKTTMVNLLMRFYEIGGGSISIDGVDIRSVRRSSLRQLFGMVLQDTWLFNGTIRDNIAYGRPGASETEIVAAARAARADRFIRTLPEGYDTVLNEEASNISQGQKQLLTIARAILADPAILILDEATSSVDTRTEQDIQAAMNALMQGRTSFVIAHRLSTIRDADLILVMQHGRIVEQGTHQSLLESGGVYAELYNSQFAGVELEEAAV